MTKLSKLIGQTLDGKYLLDKLLGQGGMGAVFLATHLGTTRPVALKVIAPQFMTNAEVGERFRREAEAAGRLRHPNVVNVTDFGFASVGADTLAYLVMEYLDGKSLGEVIKEQGQLPLAFVVDTVEQICLAIGNAHRQGIIHRDLKPDNILLQPDGRGGYIVKVLDFGLAKLRDVASDEEEDNQQSVNIVSTLTRAIGDKNADTVRASNTTQQQNLEATNIEAAATQIQALDTTNREAATLIQAATQTQTEAATMLQPATPTEIEAVTLMQPLQTEIEAATLMQSPETAELEAATLLQPSTHTAFEAATQIQAANEEGATQIQTAEDESATQIQASTDGLEKSGSATGIDNARASFAAQNSGSLQKTNASGGINSVSSTSSASVELTRVGSILGTPLYMSPEQCRSEALDPRSDIYSLGVIVYQMLAGAPPFSGSMTELMTKHCDEEPPSLKDKRKTIPDSVAKLVMSALAKSPAERPKTAEAFANALRATADSEAELLREAKAFYYSSQRTFFVLSLYVYVPFAAIAIGLSVAFNSLLTKSSAMLAAFYLLLFLLILFATRFNIAACTLVVKEQRLLPTAKIQLKPILRLLAGHLSQLFSTTMMAYAQILFGVLRLIVPGVRAYVDNAFSQAVVVLEEKSRTFALTRSKQLVSPLRPIVKAMTARDFGISLVSLVAFPCVTIVMAIVFGGTRTDAWQVVKLPMIRNFIVGYCWFILIIMHTVYSAVPLAMLYFKARQAAGETLDAATTNHLQQAETEKLADKMTKASIAWFVTPFIMLAILIGSSFLGSISGASLIDDTRNGNQANVKRKLANGASPNETRFGGTTVLMFAAKDGQAEIVKELLKAGGKLEQQDDDGDTPLIYAAIDNRAEVLQILLEAGAKVNVRNKEGKTAAMYAAQRGRIETLKLLLANGADLTIKDNKGKSALMYAEEAEQTQTLQLLKAANAND